MQGHIPPRPTGFDQESLFHQGIWDRNYGRASRARSGLTVKLDRGPGGIVARAKPGRGGGSAGLKLHRFKSMGTDHLVCRTWDGTTEGSTDIKIAKPDKLRFSITAATIDTVALAYSDYDTSAQTRSASDGTSSETQVITPRYLVNDLIWAMTCTTLVTVTGTVLTLLDLNISARAWARKFDGT